MFPNSNCRFPPIDNCGFEICQIFDKSTLISRLNREMQIVEEISLRELIFLIGFSSSFLLTSIIAKIIKTFTAPTYTKTCAAATKLALSNRYNPATLMKTPPSKKAEYTMLSSSTTPKDPIIITRDNTAKHIN